MTTTTATFTGRNYDDYAGSQIQTFVTVVIFSTWTLTGF